MEGLTRDLKWLYSYVEPQLVRRLKPEQFLLLSRKGAIGYGKFPFHEWHKRERENILREVGIQVEYGEELQEAKFKGSYTTVSDIEHVEIIKLYIEENMSMVAIAEKLKRSSGTPLKHIHRHNNAVVRSGFCSTCKRVRSQYYDRIAEKGMG